MMHKRRQNGAGYKTICLSIRADTAERIDAWAWERKLTRSEACDILITDALGTPAATAAAE